MMVKRGWRKSTFYYNGYAGPQPSSSIFCICLKYIHHVLMFITFYLKQTCRNPSFSDLGFINYSTHIKDLILLRIDDFLPSEKVHQGFSNLFLIQIAVSCL